MKKRTLNQTWTLCLRMWKWIAKQVREGSKRSVEELKSQWLLDNGFVGVEDNCFFCDSVETCSCDDCPGRLVDPDFDCATFAHNYENRPEAFYKELLRLNRIRKGVSNGS